MAFNRLAFVMWLVMGCATGFAGCGGSLRATQEQLTPVCVEIPPPPRFRPFVFAPQGPTCPPPWKMCLDEDGANAVVHDVNRFHEYSENVYLSCRAAVR